MLIGGLQKFSLLDYPDHLAAIIFTQGCNFRCQYCYNPMLVGSVDKFKNTASAKIAGAPEGSSQTDEDSLFGFLESRRGKLDAVVITGGEPLMHPGLSQFIRRIRELGYKVKLDTNGTFPERLTSLLEIGLLDYVAMDIKATPSRYDLVTGVQPDLAKIKASIDALFGCGLPHEFRTTVVPELITSEDIDEIGGLIAGAELWFLQQFRPGVDLVNPDFSQVAPYPLSVLEEMRARGSCYVKHCRLR